MGREKIWRPRYQRMGFLGVPDEVIITLGRGVERDPLSAFDKAELDAGVPDINAIPVTSFVPPGASLVTPEESRRYLRQHPVFPGSLVPAALKSYSTTIRRQERLDVKCDRIFAAIAVLLPENFETFPAIMMEYAGPQAPEDPATRSAVEQYCRDMCARVAEFRKGVGFRPQSAKVWVVEQRLPAGDKWACVLAIALYVKSTAF